MFSLILFILFLYALYYGGNLYYDLIYRKGQSGPQDFALHYEIQQPQAMNLEEDPKEGFRGVLEPTLPPQQVIPEASSTTQRSSSNSYAGSRYFKRKANKTSWLKPKLERHDTTQKTPLNREPINVIKTPDPLPDFEFQPLAAVLPGVSEAVPLELSAEDLQKAKWKALMNLAETSIVVERIDGIKVYKSTLFDS